MNKPSWDSGQLFDLSVALSAIDNRLELIRFMEESISPLLKGQVIYQFLSISGDPHDLQLFMDNTDTNTKGCVSPPERIPVTDNLAVILREQKPCISQANRFSFTPAVLDEQHPPFEKVLIVPLGLRGKLMGVLNLFSSQSDLFQPIHLLLFEQLQGVIAGAMSTIVTRQALARQAEEKGRMLEISQAVSRMRSRDDLPAFLPLLRKFFPSAEILLAALTKKDSHYTLLLKETPGSPAHTAANQPCECKYCGSSLQELLKYPGPTIFPFAEIRQRFPDEDFGWVTQADQVVEVLAIPLLWAGKATGALVVNAYRQGYFQPERLTVYGGDGRNDGRPG